MDNQHIIQTLKASASLLGQDYNRFLLEPMEMVGTTYTTDDMAAFKQDLIEAGNKLRIIYLDHSQPADEFHSFLQEIEIPVVAFEKQEYGYEPIILYKHKRELKRLDVATLESAPLPEGLFSRLYQDPEGNIVFLGIFSYKSLVSDTPDDGEKQVHFTPLQRLFRLLSEEKKDILYIFIYALFIGLISLTLPLGIQATISFISGGVVFSSVYILIALVIVGVLASGGLQVMQITLVEYLQRRVFTKAAFEFAFRVPRIKVEALTNYYAPELINRFFDVLTIQKGLPKLLIDLSAGAIQILFGLLLLSFYHPFFVFFGTLLLSLLALIFYITGPKGLHSSIKESKFKYKVVYWLEELARTINSFKLSGNTPLPIKKTDYNVNNYLKNRKIHFSVLINQYIYFLLFKALVTGGLLIIGTMLVIQREITLGQFVASEVVIILILNSVEKIIMYLDVVYDMLTAVDKIAHVTDLPLEKGGKFNLPKTSRGFQIVVKNLNYRFPGQASLALQDVNLEIRSGERICIAGAGGSGKTTLTNTIAGLHTQYEGIITINTMSLRDLNLTNLRDKIGKNVSPEDIFEGTILENILLNKPQTQLEDALWAIQEVGIGDEIHSLPEGLHTPMLSGGKGLPDSLTNKIILARCLAKRPHLLILNDFFGNFPHSERRRLIYSLIDPKHLWTLIAVSNDVSIMEACDRVILMEKGHVRASGPFRELVDQEELQEIIQLN